MQRIHIGEGARRLRPLRTFELTNPYYVLILLRAHQWQAFNAPPGGAGAVSLTSGPGVNYYPGYGGTSDAAPQASAPRSLAEAAMQYAAQSQFQPTEAVGGGGGAGEQAASAVAAATAAAAASSAPLPSPAAPM